MAIRRVLSLALMAGTLAGCEIGGRSDAGTIESDGVVPAGAIPAAPDVRPGQPARAESAPATVPGALPADSAVAPMPDTAGS